MSIKFRVTIETMVSKYTNDKNEKATILVDESFETKKEANKRKRELMKEYELTKHHFYIVNYEKQIELFTNY